MNVVYSKLGVACLDRECYNDVTERYEFRSHYADIRYTLPMTDCKDLRKQSQSSTPIQIVFSNGHVDKRLFKSYNQWSDECSKISRIKDSLLSRHDPKLENPLYYAQHTVKKRNNFVQRDSIRINKVNVHGDTLKLPPFWVNFYTTSDEIVTQYMRGIDWCFAYRSESYINIPLPSTSIMGLPIEGVYMGNPSSLAMEDISQQYFNLELDYDCIDSISLTIDFVGSTLFSKMSPEPDAITMSSITFTDQSKIQQISKSGLQFHAQFVELQNRQQVRLFLLTSIMAGLFTIFIIFFIVGSYKMVRAIKQSKKTAQIGDSKGDDMS